jgi:hypothetical protein
VHTMPTERAHRGSCTYVSCILSNALVSVLSEAIEDPPAELEKLHEQQGQAQHTAAGSTQHGF